MSSIVCEEWKNEFFSTLQIENNILLKLFTRLSDLIKKIKHTTEPLDPTFTARKTFYTDHVVMAHRRIRSTWSVHIIL